MSVYTITPDYLPCISLPHHGFYDSVQLQIVNKKIALRSLHFLPVVIILNLN